MKGCVKGLTTCLFSTEPMRRTFSVYCGPFQSIVGLFSIVWAFSVYCGPFQYIVTFKNDHNSRDEFEICFFIETTLKNQMPYHFHSWNIL